MAIFVCGPCCHQGMALALGLAGLLLPKDLGGLNAKARHWGGHRGGSGYPPAAGRPLEQVPPELLPDRSPPLAGVRRVSEQKVTGGALPCLSGRGGHTGACVARLPVSGWSAPQNARRHTHDTDAAAGRRRRRRLGLWLQAPSGAAD